jgi:hypothetical protein
MLEFQGFGENFAMIDYVRLGRKIGLYRGAASRGGASALFGPQHAAWRKFS